MVKDYLPDIYQNDRLEKTKISNSRISRCSLINCRMLSPREASLYTVELKDCLIDSSSLIECDIVDCSLTENIAESNRDTIHQQITKCFFASKEIYERDMLTMDKKGKVKPYKGNDYSKIVGVALGTVAQGSLVPVLIFGTVSTNVATNFNISHDMLYDSFFYNTPPSINKEKPRFSKKILKKAEDFLKETIGDKNFKLLKNKGYVKMKCGNYTYQFNRDGNIVRDRKSHMFETKTDTGRLKSNTLPMDDLLVTFYLWAKTSPKKLEEKWGCGTITIEDKTKEKV